MTNHTHRSRTIAEYNRVIGEVREFITGNYQRDITLDDYCARYSRSRRSAQRSLSWAETSWRAELVKYRMNIAKSLIKTTGMYVSSISLQVGYKQPAQFAKAFKMYTGKSPVEFRESDDE